MPVTTPPAVAALPSAPDPNDRSTFNTRAYPWSAALPGFSAQVAAVATNVFDNATEAATSASTAATQAAFAASSSNSAAAQVALATAQATNSANSATSSANSAAEAEASRIAASKLNLGNKATAPTLDNQGAALLAGTTYYDTALNRWRVYTGSAWGDGVSAVAGVSSVNGQTGDVTGLQATLVSGTNIKTVNGGSLMGAGDLAVQPTLVSGTNIKTVNGGSLMGAGDLAVGGGSWVLLGTVTALNSTTVVLEQFSLTYDNYVIVISDMSPSSSGSYFTCNLKYGNSYNISTNHRHMHQWVDESTYNVLSFSSISGGNFFRLSPNGSPSPTDVFSAVIWMFGVNQSSSIKAMSYESSFCQSGVMQHAKGQMHFAGAVAAIQGIRFQMNAGNIASGNFSIYGIKKI